MKKLILSVVLCLALCFAASAQMPKIGDCVRISCSSGDVSMFYEGNITGISEGLICLNCTQAGVISGNKRAGVGNAPQNVCIGTGQISALIWLKGNNY